MFIVRQRRPISRSAKVHSRIAVFQGDVVLGTESVRPSSVGTMCHQFQSRERLIEV